MEGAASNWTDFCHLLAPLNVLFIPYVVLVALSAYTLIGIVASIDGDRVRERLKAVPARLVGSVLIALSAAAVAGLTVQVITELSGSAPGVATLRGARERSRSTISSGAPRR